MTVVAYGVERGVDSLLNVVKGPSNGAKHPFLTPKSGQ